MGICLTTTLRLPRVFLGAKIGSLKPDSNWLLATSDIFRPVKFWLKLRGLDQMTHLIQYQIWSIDRLPPRDLLLQSSHFASLVGCMHCLLTPAAHSPLPNRIDSCSPIWVTYRFSLHRKTLEACMIGLALLRLYV